MPDPFGPEEERLLARGGNPLPLGLGEAVTRAGEVLAKEMLAREVASEAGGSAGRSMGSADHGGVGREGIIRFDPDFELDLVRYELRRNGNPVHVEPQVFEVLAYLAANPGRLVTREELMDQVWATRFVSAAVVNSRIRSARAATGDDGKRQACSWWPSR